MNSQTWVKYGIYMPGDLNDNPVKIVNTQSYEPGAAVDRVYYYMSIEDWEAATGYHWIDRHRYF